MNHGGRRYRWSLSSNRVEIQAGGGVVVSTYLIRPPASLPDGVICGGRPPALSRRSNHETIPAFVTGRLRPAAAARFAGGPPLYSAAGPAACPSDRVYCYRPDLGRLAAAGVGSGRDQCELSADMFRAFPSTHNSCRRRHLAPCPRTLTLMTV